MNAKLDYTVCRIDFPVGVLRNKSLIINMAI
jgi:hypothetical protein